MGIPASRTPGGEPIDLQLRLKPGRSWVDYATVAVTVVLVVGTLIGAPASQRAWAVAFPLFFGGLWIYTWRGSSLIVTPEHVIDRSVTRRRVSVQRNRVAALERRSAWILLRDADGTLIMKTSGWTGAQVRELADALGVPLDDRVSGHGLRGRLMS